MTNSNNDIEELEELLSELEGQEAQIVTPYSEEDDAVTRLMDAPLGDQDWMVQVTALDRRMMSTSQVMSELQQGKINTRTLVWRGGMDDWMPISRVEELARGGAMPSRTASQRPSAPRAAFAPLANPAQQPSQPVWARPANAPLPPPPRAKPPPFGMASGAGLPPPPLALVPPPPPVALTPPPPPPVSSFGLSNPMPLAPLPEPPLSQSTGFSQSNTTRPVAVDFSDMPIERDPPLQSKRWVMGLSAVAILAVFVTVYSLSSGGGENEAKAKTAATPAAAVRPQAVNALQPAPAAKEKAAPAPAPSAAATKPEAAAPAKSDEDESEPAAGSTRQTAQARYSPRSEWRRRSRAAANSESSSRSEPAEAAEEPATPARAAVAPAPSSSTRANAEEEAPSEPAAAAEEVDEAPKSTARSGNTFNRDAAKKALEEAAVQAKNCRPQGGPSGTGQVQVRYEPSGKVQDVTILTSKFDNTTAGSCVRMLFRRAKVPEFTGAPVVVVNKSFEIP